MCKLNPVLAAAALAGAGILGGCSATSRHASTQEEKLDEIRVIAAIARSQEKLRKSPVCVARLISSESAFEQLATTELVEVDRYLEKRWGRGKYRPDLDRALDDAAITGALGKASAGDACTGSAFFEFARVQFMGRVAVATALKTDVTDCGTERVLFRVKRERSGWEVHDVLLMSRSSPYSCEQRSSATLVKFVQLGNKL